MISYTHGASDVPLIGEPIGELLDRVAHVHASHEAVVSVHQGVRMTYGQLAKACNEVARGLMALGVGHGDRVGIWSTNNVEWVIVQFATAKIGAILVNVNPAYRTVELEYALRQSGVSVLFSQGEYKTSDYLAMIEEVRDRLPELRSVIVIDGNARRDEDLRWGELRTIAEAIPPEQLALRQQATQFDEAINIQYTSGTTGFPKGATLSHHNILNNGFFIGEGCRYTAADRVCIPVPFYHCFGMVLGNLA
ncbi:MAG TPA: AMP-binding protein, partial [Verrucomicrobiae bacterium]|nr:AMP-binding protein [Verrucomicrobiae bacterium]